MPTVETITLEQLPNWAAVYADTLAKADFGPAFDKIAVLLAASAKENFFGSHSPDGVLWLPLKYRQGLPLRDTGMLMASMTAGGAGHYERRTRTRLEWGTNLDYAGFHQDGTQRIPARPFLGFNELLIQDIEAVLAEFAGEQLSG